LSTVPWFITQPAVEAAKVILLKLLVEVNPGAVTIPVKWGVSFAVRRGVVVGLVTDIKLFAEVTEVTDPPPAEHAVLVDTITPELEERQSPEVKLPAPKLVVAAIVPGAIKADGILRTGLTPPEEVI
jgi:hypothetical protein